jgi:hypothetical protein
VVQDVCFFFGMNIILLVVPPRLGVKHSCLGIWSVGWKITWMVWNRLDDCWAAHEVRFEQLSLWFSETSKHFLERVLMGGEDRRDPFTLPRKDRMGQETASKQQQGPWAD